MRVATFQAEVFRVLRTQHFLEVAYGQPSDHFRDHKNFATFLARFALTRPYSPYDGIVDHFPAVVNRVLDEIVRAEPLAHDIDRVRSDFMLKLCHITRDQCVTHYIPTDESTFEDHLLVAAIRLNRMGLVDILLASRKDLSRAMSRFWGTPLVAAISIENVDLLQRLSQLGASWPSSETPMTRIAAMESIVRSARAMDIIDILLESNSVSKVCVIYGDAIRLAMNLDRFDVAMAMLEVGCSGYYTLWTIPGMERSSTIRTLFPASKKKQPEIIQKILELYNYFESPRWSNPRRTEISQKACEEGQEVLLQILLEPDRKKFAPHPWLHYVLKATADGRVGLIRILVDEGIIPKSRLRNAEALRIFAEAVAHRTSAKVIEYLLEDEVIDLAALREAKTDVGYELVHCVIGAAQRGNFELLKVVALRGFSLDDEEYYARADCPLPILAAKAFRQTAAVDALLRLGIRDVDPLQSMLAQGFASGEYPRDLPWVFWAGLEGD